MGYVPISIPNYQILCGLGRGRYSCVYKVQAVTQPSRELVAKVYINNPSMAKLEKERLQALKAVLGKGNQSAVSEVGAPFEIHQNNDSLNIPLVVADIQHDAELIGIIVEPVGKMVLPCGGISGDGVRTVGKHYADLVSVIEKAHSVGIIHRDIKPNNILVYYDGVSPDGIIILNDWSSSYIGNAAVRWIGTYGYSSYVDGLYVPNKIDDCNALIKTIYSLVTQESPPEERDHVDSFWNSRLTKDSIWGKLLQYAMICSYSDIRDAVQILK